MGTIFAALLAGTIASAQAYAAPTLRLIEVKGLLPHGRHVEVFIPCRKPERVVLYFFGDDTEVAKGYMRKADQIKDQFEGHCVALITPDIGHHPGSHSHTFITKEGKPKVDVLSPVYEDISRWVGIELSKLPLVAVCFSGGCPHMRDFLQSGRGDTQFDLEGGAIVLLGGHYGDLKPVLEKYSAPIVSISTADDTPKNKERLAERFGKSILELDDMKALRRGDKVFINIPREHIHFTMPADGYVRRVLDLTKR